MLSGMLGAALMVAAFAVGFKTGQGSKAEKPRTEPQKTAEEIKRERDFKRFMRYDGGSSAGQKDI